jgi:phage shock protein A
MANYFRRRWQYFMARSNRNFEERADPKVQLEQAIGEAQDQHRRLVEQAAVVVANQKQTEMQLNRAMDELERVTNSTRQALRMAEDAAHRGETERATEYNQTAEAFANRLIATENQVEELKTRSLQAAQAAQQAKASVQQNATALQQKLAERQKLLSQLDQAKMQEQLNAAMGALSSTADQDVPTLDQVRSKIEQRYARALGTSELGGQDVNARMLEVEQAAMGSEARGRLAEMREQMGLPAAPGGGELGAPVTGQLAAGQSPEAAGARPGQADALPGERPDPA